MIRTSLRYVLDHLSPTVHQRIVLSSLARLLRKGTEDELQSLFETLDLFLVALEDRQRQLHYSSKQLPVRQDYSGNSILKHHVMDKHAPWLTISPGNIGMPGMLAYEEIQYYHYISRFYSGAGEVVELGPWLGLSTRHIMSALSYNPTFAGRKLHVFDDFVWRSDWMDPHFSEGERPRHHESFQHLFEGYTASVANRLHVTKAKFTDYDGNMDVPLAEWHKGAIEMIFVDCGRTYQANQGWYNIFSYAFVPDLTLVIMQDWRLHRERPRRHYNQTLHFTQEHPRLELIHEVRHGGVGTFLFR
jgi:hypothetical protein